MQQLILSQAQAADAKKTPTAPIEQLVWMGTAYGRRAAAKTKQAPAKPKTAGTKTAFSISAAKMSHRVAVKTAYAVRGLSKTAAAYQHRNSQTTALAFMAVCAAVAAATLVQSFVPDGGDPQPLAASIPASDAATAPRNDLAASSAGAADTSQPVAVQSAQPEPALAVVAGPAPAPEPAAKTLEPADTGIAAKAALELANAAAAQSKLALEGERTARVQAEEKAAALSSDLALNKAGRDRAETSAAEMKALLETERKSRAEAEQAARTAQDDLKRKIASQAEAAEPQETRVGIAARELAREPITSASRPEPREESRSAPSPSRPAENISSNSTLMTQALKEGQNLLAKGELAAARKQFEKAAIAGLPEGALALGETFDPVALSKAGFKQGGDAVRAREWYRRAHELARTPPRPRRQAHRMEPETQSNLQIPRLE